MDYQNSSHSAAVALRQAHLNESNRVRSGNAAGVREGENGRQYYK